MSEQKTKASRREFLLGSGRLVAASALAGVALPHVHAAGSDVQRVALVGAGARGTGAALDALRAGGEPLRLVALADVFDHRLASSHRQLSRRVGPQVDVPQERRFLGFDAYRHAMDALSPGDIVILASPPAFRWVHFQYAIEKGLHVFMEKPMAVDAPTGRRMLELGREAERKGLKVAVGLMVRHCRGRLALKERIEDGAIGDLIMLRAYRMHGPQGTAFSSWDQKREGMTELMFQVARFHSFLWLSGGLFNDFYIHQIDECCWMKGAWPVRCHALGGRHFRGDAIDQNFDAYHVEYSFDDGTKLLFNGRTMPGCRAEFSSIAHGTRGSATITLNNHHLGQAGRLFPGHAMLQGTETWAAFPDEEAPDPYFMEWVDFLEAIREGKPCNEVERSTIATLVTCMGRYAAHTGQEVTWDEYLAHEHEFAPGVDALTLDGPSPLVAGDDGLYPVPQPGVTRTREYDVEVIT